MSYKRSRAAYEADLQQQQSPFVLFGTPLPPLDPEVRDDGSYVPVWKQEVRDERGRKRLHGAFTGGWSAGYFNTVGSKEGWAPSTFVSSRANRRKDGKDAGQQQRPEDFMDEEDLADAEEARKIQTSQAFAGLGATEHDAVRASGLAGLFRVEGETMGTKLLKKMGWREGQGIGPKVRRKARLDVANKPVTADKPETFLFAPENVPMIGFTRKMDRKGLGYEGAARLTPLDSTSKLGRLDQSDDEDEVEDGPLRRARASIPLMQKKASSKSSGGIGIGVLNDTGSDDEDPYEMGPRISYNRVIGGDKKKKKKDLASATPVNPTLRSKPVFVSKKAALARVALGVRKCHDGRLPLDGFVFAQEPDPLISMINAEGKYPPPTIPPDWKSNKQAKDRQSSSAYLSTADAAKASKLDPKSRAALLGEQQLPGKSVFDFMSASARDKLAAVTGKSNLPQAKGEIPEGYALSADEKLRQLMDQVPSVDKETAVAAITRGAAGGGPYGDDEAKRSRYRAYLEYQAGYESSLPSKPPKMNNDDWLREFQEFYNVARIFKPMTGLMASRFTTSSSTSKLATGSDGKAEDKDLISRPPAKPSDPAEEAAKMGMYGEMTRSVKDFYPTRLLCKRFNVKPPAHVQPDQSADVNSMGKNKSSAEVYGDFSTMAQGPGNQHMIMPNMAIEPHDGRQQNPIDLEPGALSASKVPTTEPDIVIDATRNEALEGQRAGEEVFKAIFGDSSDDED
ncbi:putative g patch domain-containing protein 1 protein [Phaeoacremonium minimum UCRPA7]|uniref:Putative g patch domain-containing protein 1 protein n=1 Tax=Phaeoacremonium minimum (strain UCR-PA7) TaxID=1286976 RepID=R8BKG4_PHAM7|nr:putative g patch domain-containing protein 1 protein [Phaeoacremonium minimum UCRPA7]EON99838.1 putative g patch domain-containing protein 1 protein [Phaeoacremonium minimum UCRPA7]